MRDRDLGLHPSEQAPNGYQVKLVGNRYFPMRRCADGEYHPWTRRDARGVPTAALSFATARAAAHFCRRRGRDQL